MHFFKIGNSILFNLFFKIIFFISLNITFVNFCVIIILMLTNVIFNNMRKVIGVSLNESLVKLVDGVSKAHHIKTNSGAVLFLLRKWQVMTDRKYYYAMVRKNEDEAIDALNLGANPESVISIISNGKPISGTIRYLLTLDLKE